MQSSFYPESDDDLPITRSPTRTEMSLEHVYDDSMFTETARITRGSIINPSHVIAWPGVIISMSLNENFLHGYSDPNLNAFQNIYVSRDLMHRIDWIDRHEDFRDSSAAFNGNKYNPSKWYKKGDGVMVAAEADIYGVYPNVHEREQGPFRMYVMPPGA